MCVNKNKITFVFSILFPVILCAVVVLLIWTIHLFTSDRIAAHQEQQTKNALQAAYENFDTYEPIQTKVELIGSSQAIYKVYAPGHILQGFAVPTTINNAGNETGLLVCMDKNAVILNIHILHTTETNTLNARVLEEDYLAAFKGKSGPFVLNRDIEAVSGATDSSKNLLSGVNDATATCRKLLGLEAE